jgi:hypothetical protein
VAGSLYALTFGVYVDMLLRGPELLTWCPLPAAATARLLAGLDSPA